jgi:uncharacterized protein
MAGGSLIALIDDIATILDDVSILTKVAAKKTAGVLGDDLALNAQQVAGVNADRELPVVWAVAKGSLLNKCILVPAALIISLIAPWAIMPLLMLGGAFLCFEGFEKIAHQWLHSASEEQAHEQALMRALEDPKTDFMQLEKEKIKGAIRTDFILSAEIIVITLGTVKTASFAMQSTVLAGISVIMTVGVYGLVAAIVKLDDLGLYLMQTKNTLKRKLGGGILAFAPYLMKTLSIVGTAAMFLVGGHIIVEGIPTLHHAVGHLTADTTGLLRTLASVALDGFIGVLTGALVLAGVTLFSTFKK